MLVLSRKPEESVVIARPHSLEPMVKVTVVGIRGGKVRLAFDASTEFPVHRWEVWERIRANCRPGPLAADPVGPVARDASSAVQARR
jgi:carbon storage regulator CsrA